MAYGERGRGTHIIRMEKEGFHGVAIVLSYSTMFAFHMLSRMTAAPNVGLDVVCLGAVRRVAYAKRGASLIS